MPAWIDSIAHAPPPLMVFALLAAGLGGYLGFASLRRYRLIEDVPTAKVRSAHQGYVELIGRAVMMEGEPIVAPLSGIQCCWYSYSVEQKSGKSWHRVRGGVSDSLFLLRDATGDCLIDPEGAEVDTVHARRWFADAHGLKGGVHQRSHDGSAHQAAGPFAGLNLQIGLGLGDYRYFEKVILDGDPLYAIGWFKSLGDSDRAESEDLLTRDILRQWKAHPETLRERFDNDRDGVIGIEEWEGARRAARALARQQLAGQQPRHDQVHTLGRPAGHKFILANRHQGALVSRYRWRAIGGFLAFFVGGAAATLMISTRFFGG